MRSISYKQTAVPFSDHECLCGVFEGDGKKTFWVWKLNVSLLEDERVMRDFRCVYEEWKERDIENVLKWWDWMKGNIKSFFFRKWGYRKAAQKINKYKELTRLEWLRKVSKVGVDVSHLIEAKRDLRKAFEEKGKEIIEKGEQCTRFFFKKMCGRKLDIDFFRNEEGLIVEGNDGLEVIKLFYKKKEIDKELGMECFGVLKEG